MSPLNIPPIQSSLGTQSYPAMEGYLPAAAAAQRSMGLPAASPGQAAALLASQVAMTQALMNVLLLLLLGLMKGGQGAGALQDARGATGGGTSASDTSGGGGAAGTQESSASGGSAAGGVSGPVNIGSLKDLTWDKATAIVRSKGGKLFENGQPTVLALRTRNAGTKAYEDYFVVLKPNGEMKTFEGTTRPGFTTDSGGWSPEMVVPGNYKLTPRWRDGKFNNDAFIVGSVNGGMSVETAKDRDGDGQYSASEIANSGTSSEIRLHRGNATTTSSAGCFNIKDYDAFLAFIGGRDVSFNLTLVEV